MNWVCKISFFAIVLLTMSVRVSAVDNPTNLLEKACQAFAKQKYKQALVYQNAAIKLETNNPVAFWGRGCTYARLKEFDKALGDFNKGIELSAHSYLLSHALWYRGNFYLQITNNEKALDDFTKAIHEHPAVQPPYTSRAEIYFAKSKYDSAIVDCNMAIWLNPDDGEAYFAKGRSYLELKDYDKAIEALSNALRCETNNSDIFYKRAGAFSGKEDYTNAIKDLDQTIRLSPKAPFAFSARGLLRSRIGEYRSGISDCWRAVRLDANCNNACNNLAWLLSTAPEPKLRDGKQAFKYATRACELSEWKDAYNIGTLAAACAEIGRFDEAINWEKKCIELGLPTEKEKLQAQKELELFEQGKPYHAD